MKTTKKWFAILITVMLLCSGLASLSASAAASPENAYLMIVVVENSNGSNNNDDGEKIITYYETAAISLDSQAYAIAPALSNSFDLSAVSFKAAGQNGQYDVNLVKTADNFSVFSIQGNNVSTIQAKSMANVDEVFLLSYNDQTRSIEQTQAAVNSIDNNGIAKLSSSSDSIESAAAVDANGNFVGYYIGSNTVLSSDYINTVLSNSGQNNGSGGGSGSGTGSGGTNTNNNRKGGIIVPSLLGLVIIGGLIFLLVTKKGNNNGSVLPMANDPMQPILPVDNISSTGRICIKGSGGQFNGRKFEMDGSLTIGRQEGRCNICYPSNERGISGIHCQLRQMGNQIELIDLGSSYGTYVNGQAISPNTPVMLNVGDRFWLANEKNTFIVYQ